MLQWRQCHLGHSKLAQQKVLKSNKQLAMKSQELINGGKSSDG